MHITLNLTTGCNMNCSYCYAPPKQREDMSENTMAATIDFIAKYYPLNTGIIFFGGEPLLKKELIASAIKMANDKSNGADTYFHYKITTNGILLDEEFLAYADAEKLQVSMSFDGVSEAHDTCRKLYSGMPSFDLIESKTALLLMHQSNAKVLITITPATVQYYAQSFRFLIEKGFRYIIASIDYSGLWTDEKIRILKKQYKIIATLYKKYIDEERKFYFSPFEMKLASHIRRNNFECYRCHLGVKQLSVAIDGAIYPCVQFIGRKEFCLGNVWDGIDESKRKQLYSISNSQDERCNSCAYYERCNNKCSCLSIQTTGLLNSVSEVLCETERALIPIVDKLGEELYQSNKAMFVQKHYNAVYPILSMMDDMM